MRLLPGIESIQAGTIPMLGNLATGGVIGLTPEGHALCEEMRQRDVDPSEVPDSCEVLVQHLARGGYLACTDEAEDVMTKPTTLASAYLHVTQRCNLSCAFCYSDGEDRNRLADPISEQLSNAIDLLASLGCKRLVISGGEPFLRSDLQDIATHARNVGIGAVVVLTNGLLITQERVEPLVGLVDTIGIAFDGTSAKAPAHLRGRQNFEILVESVKAVVATGITARIIPTIHGKNLGDMPAYRELAASLGAEVSFSLLTGYSSHMGEFCLNEQQLKSLAEDALANQMNIGEEITVGADITLSARKSCGVGVRTLSIAADGTIYPCHMLHVRELAMGNAFGEAAHARAQLESSQLRQQLQELSVDSIKGCDTCSVRYLCGGGCRARTYVDGLGLHGMDSCAALSCTYYDRIVSLLERQFTAKRG